jgi:hypothetical protein
MIISVCRIILFGMGRWLGKTTIDALGKTFLKVIIEETSSYLNLE